MTPLAPFIFFALVLLTTALLITCALDRVGSAIDRQPNQQGPERQAVTKKKNRAPYSTIWYSFAAILFLGFLSLVAFGYVNKWRAGDWTAVFSLALVFSTIALAMFAKWQRDVMQNELETAQRAWLSVDLKPRGADDKVMYWNLIIKNTGQTPGRVTRTRMQAFRERPSKDSVPRRTAGVIDAMAEQIPGENPVAPQGEILVPDTIIDLPHYKFFNSPGRDGKDMFVIVRIEYEDVFAVKHITQKCCLLFNLGHPIVYKYGNHMT